MKWSAVPWVWVALAGGVIVYLLVRPRPAAAGSVDLTIGRVYPLGNMF